MELENLVEIVDNVVKSKINYEKNYNSFGELLFKTLRKYETKITLVDNDTGRKWTASEVLDAIVTLGMKFSAWGISKGDVVAFLCPNSDLHVIAKLTLWSIGVVYTGLVHKSPLSEFLSCENTHFDVYLMKGELQNIVTKSRAIYLIGSKETIDVCNDFLSSSNSIKKFFVIDECYDENVTSIYSMIKGKVENKEREKFFVLMSNVKPTDLCKISFSSGTTGPPKAVIERQWRYIAYIRFTAPEIGLLNDTDTCALIQPLQHDGGSMILCISLLSNTCVVVFKQFDCDHFISDVIKHQITFASLVPSYIIKLNRTITEPMKPFCLKKVTTSGEFSEEVILKEFIEKFKPNYFAQGYGSTEAGWLTIVPLSEGISNLKSVGVPTPGTLFKVIDIETGKKLGSNKHGEIYVKGPETTEGYLNNEEANRDSFDEELFFKSGDIGYFDERGLIYIIDRIKEVIKYNTQQVSPSELQSILLMHESVKEAAVVGIRDEMFGELPKAFVVITEEFKGKVNEDELLEFVNAKVMDFKKLRGGLTFITELPKSSLGKIDRKALKVL